MRLDFCAACGRKDGLNHHHLVAKAHGGSNRETNLITLCRECHAKQHHAEGDLWSNDIRHLVRLGKARAKAKGVKFGRPPKMTKEQCIDALERRRNGETLAAIAQSYGVSQSLICRLQEKKLSLGDALKHFSAKELETNIYDPQPATALMQGHPMFRF